MPKECFDGISDATSDENNQDNSAINSNRIQEIDQFYANIDSKLRKSIQELAQAVRSDSKSFKLRYFKKTLETVFNSINDKMQADVKYAEALLSDTDYVAYSEQFTVLMGHGRVKEKQTYAEWKDQFDGMIQEIESMQKTLTAQITQMTKFLEQ
ncbi:uncharacterized protein LOC134845459 isoform X2 [Symsagittifera roscoffensis]|uniref:uncharacterized protein LOC134845459 isoform X2 n=1 Tax=Symsagittifera roscoffensis TaxID=84072 RepID=UPI00307B8D1C